MKNNFKGTQGRWILLSNGEVSCGKFQIEHFFDVGVASTEQFPSQQYRANAELIADAGNVRQQIDCSLSELLEQRNKLLECLTIITEKGLEGDLDSTEDFELAADLIDYVNHSNT